MKRSLLLTSLTILIFINLANSQSWRSSNQLYGTSDLSVIATCSDAYNNTYLYGYFNGSITVSETEQLDTRGARDLFLAKYDAASNLLWIKGIGGDLNEFLLGGMCISTDEYIFITGSFQSDFYYSDTEFLTSSGSHDIFLGKYSLDGDVLWFRNVGTGASYQRSTALRSDADSNILLAGYFNDSITIAGDTTVYEFNDFKDYYIAKFEPENGDFQWIKSYESINSDYSGFIYSINTTDNSYYLSGVFGDSVRIENDTIVSETPTYYDAHIIKTDTSGNVEWIRLIKGNWHDYSYTSTIDSDANIYITGYFNSTTLTVDSTETTSIVVYPTGADYDFFIAKYSSDGTLNWIRVNGGDGEDRLLRSEIYNNELHVSGYFSDILNWGGIELTTNGLTDQDMFTGIIDLDGNYRSANSFGGTNNSAEAGIAVFNTTDAIYQVIQSNSELLVLGDSSYTSTSGFNYVVVGVIGCLPIVIDKVTLSDDNLLTCYGDSLESIEIEINNELNGFGLPWRYSIDNGQTSSDSSIFYNVPAGDFRVVVYDSEGCAQAVDTSFTIYQPDELILLLKSLQNPWEINEKNEGYVEVEARGGTGDYTYILQPGDREQINDGLFTFTDEEAGIYEISVDDANECGPVSLHFEIVLGFETKSGIEAKVYPNPTSGLITVEMLFDGNECDMEVINMNGQLVMKRRVYSNGGVINETLDLSNQAKGLYMIRINGGVLQSAIMVK